MSLTPRFAGKVALITGGGAGIGRATALRMAAEGSVTAVADIRPERAESVKREIESIGGTALAIQCDVTRPDENTRMVSEVVRACGRLHILVTSAGIGEGRRLIDIPVDEMDDVLNLDLRSVMLTSRCAIPEMQRAGGGAIVHIASIDGVRGSTRSVFCAAKFGVVGLSQSLAVAHARDNIRVNCVCPGVVLTPLTQDWLSDEKARADAIAWHPMGRIGTADEIAAAIAFLASDEASFITGAVLAVDGGYLAAGRG